MPRRLLLGPSPPRIIPALKHNASLIMIIYLQDPLNFEPTLQIMDIPSADWKENYTLYYSPPFDSWICWFGSWSISTFLNWFLSLSETIVTNNEWMKNAAVIEVCDGQSRNVMIEMCKERRRRRKRKKLDSLLRCILSLTTKYACSSLTICNPELKSLIACSTGAICSSSPK